MAQSYENLAGISDGDCRRLVRALERRFGQSTMPYVIKPVPNGSGFRCLDQETGSYIDALVRGRRLSVLKEYDAA